jgi:hypothetical protein
MGNVLRSQLLSIAAEILSSLAAAQKYKNRTAKILCLVGAAPGAIKIRY